MVVHLRKPLLWHSYGSDAIHRELSRSHLSVGLILYRSKTKSRLRFVLGIPGRLLIFVKLIAVL